MSERLCEYCKKNKLPEDRRVRYCSDECKKKALTEYRKNYNYNRFHGDTEYQETHREMARESARARLAKMRAMKTVEYIGDIADILKCEPSDNEKLELANYLTTTFIYRNK